MQFYALGCQAQQPLEQFGGISGKGSSFQGFRGTGLGRSIFCSGDTISCPRQRPQQHLMPGAKASPDPPSQGGQRQSRDGWMGSEMAHSNMVSAEGTAAEPLQQGQGGSGSPLPCSSDMGLVFWSRTLPPFGEDGPGRTWSGSRRRTGCDRPVSLLIQSALESILAAAWGEPDPIRNYLGWPAPGERHVSADDFTNVVCCSVWPDCC